jgi:hypothetical protein
MGMEGGGLLIGGGGWLAPGLPEEDWPPSASGSESADSWLGKRTGRLLVRKTDRATPASEPGPAKSFAVRTQGTPGVWGGKGGGGTGSTASGPRGPAPSLSCRKIGRGSDSRSGRFLCTGTLGFQRRKGERPNRPFSRPSFLASFSAKSR